MTSFEEMVCDGIRRAFEKHEGCFNRDESLSINIYYDMIDSKNLIDEFLWDMNKDPTILERDNFFAWVDRKVNAAKKMKR